MQRAHVSRSSLALAALLTVALAASGATASRAAGVHATPRTPATSYALATIPTRPGASQPNADPNATLTLDFASGSEISTGDPQVMNSLDEISVGSAVFAPLLALTANDQVAANAAQSMAVSADGRTYTFTLRPGMTYTDGQPVTAADYAFAIKRACSPVVNGNYSSILYAIVGCQAWRTVDLSKVSKAKVSALAHVVDQSIKALDARTLQIKLTQAAGYFPYVMTTWVTYPSRPDLVQKGGTNWWKSPQYYVGNGPFKLVSWTPNRQWVFVRNDHYFRGTPGIKTLVYKEISNVQTAFLAYTQGEFDAIGPDATLLPEIRRNATLQRQLIRTVNAETDWIQFNDAARPFTDVRVRQAIAYALDRQRYINQVENGVGQPAGTLLYPGILGYQTKFQQTYDPARARKLLAEAGYPNGRGFPTEELRYASDDPASKQQATFWAQDLKQVLGINIQVTPTDRATLDSMIYNRNPALKIFFSDWYQDYPHPQDWLSLIFANGSSLAPLGWNDAHFNALVTRADQLPINEAVPLYQEADAYLAQQAPVAFYLHDEVLMLIKPNLKGYVRYPGDPFDLTFQPEKIYKTKS